MRIPRVFTSVAAALALLYGSGCSSQNNAGAYRIVPGYGAVPAGAVVDPNTGIVTYPQTYVAGTAVYDPALAYAAAPVYQPVVAQAAPATARKAKPRKKARYARRNTRFATVGARNTAQGYSIANPGYGTATLLSDPNIVPSVTVAPVITAPVAAEPVAVPVAAEPVAAGPVVTVTRYAATDGAEQIAQVAGANCGTTYRRGRRVKTAKPPRRPKGYVPYAVTAPVPAPASVTYSAECAPVVAAAPVVYAAPLPAATYTPQPLPEEPAVAEKEVVKVDEKVAEKPAGVDIDKLAEAVAAKLPKPEAPKAAEVDIEALADAVAERLSETLAAASQPVTQPVVIQPIIQPIVQETAARLSETAAVQVQAPVPAPVPTPLPAEMFMPAPDAAVPYMPLPQGPVVSEPLSAMVRVPGAASGFEPGILNTYCPPEICPVPDAMVCAPGQNLSECFTMNDFQLQNTPLQVLRPDMNAPLAFAPAGAAVIVSQPVTEQAQETEAGKYQALTPAREEAPPATTLSVRPNIAPPEVSMPAPLGGEIMPPVPATAEIESALDAMLSRDTRTPVLK